MNSHSDLTLQQDAVRSAEIYLNYLNAHKTEGKGMFSAQVRSVQGTLLDTDLVLNLDRRMRSADGMMIRIGGTVYENTEGATYFFVQSHDKRKVVISPMPELAEHIDAALAANEQIYVEVDLTFLVKRVKNWYEKHGDEVTIPSAIPGCSLDTNNPIALSADQTDCAVKAMTSPLSYIWGAPGTGKTKHVLASCIYSYIMAGKKVLLLAPTNTALDQSLSGLLQALSRKASFTPDGKVYRLGVPGDIFKMAWPNISGRGAYEYLKMELEERISWLKYENSMIQNSLDVRTGKAEAGTEDRYPGLDAKTLTRKKKDNLNEINSLLKTSHKMAEQKSVMPLFSRFSVIAATVDACIHWIPPDGSFRPDHVFLDEAGYCNVIKGMTLTAFNCPVTMLGDHMQLPPVFDCEDNKLINQPATRIVRLWQISTLYNEDVIFSDDRSQLCAHELTERPRFDHTTVGALTETHRFGPELARVLAGRIYRNNFRSRSENETRILYINAPKNPQDMGKDESGDYKRISHTESRCIRALIEHNLYHPDYSLGIITPYRKQRRVLDDSIRRLLKKYEITDDMDEDILTVHRSQGREWDVVIFSVTDHYDERWSTDTTRRETNALKLINTAVSRARKMLVLVGDADSWIQHDGQLISDLFRVAQPCSTDIHFREYCTEQKD